MLMTAEDVVRMRLDEMCPSPIPYIGKSMESDWQMHARHDTAKRELKRQLRAQQELERRQRDYEKLGYEREIMRKPREGGPSAEQIIAAVALACRIPREFILTNKRSKRLVHARHIIAWELRYRKCWSLPRIGELLDRDQSTIGSSIQLVRKDRQRFEDQIQAVARMLAA